MQLSANIPQYNNHLVHSLNPLSAFTIWVYSSYDFVQDFSILSLQAY